MYVKVPKSRAVHRLDCERTGAKIPRIVGGVELRTPCGKAGPFSVVKTLKITCKVCKG